MRALSIAEILFANYEIRQAAIKLLTCGVASSDINVIILVE